MTNLLEEVILIPVVFCLNYTSKALQKNMSKRFHTNSCLLWEAVMYASIEELVNTDTDEVHHGS